MHQAELNRLNAMGDTRSLFVIQLAAESMLESCCISTDPTPGAQRLSTEAKEVLTKLTTVNDLDLAHLMIAEAVGDTTKVEELKAWIIKKAARNGGRFQKGDLS